MKSRTFIFVVVLFLTGLGGAAFLYLLQPTPQPDSPIHVDIADGASFAEVAELLQQQHVIKSSWAFRWMARLQGADRKIIPGEYAFRDSMEPSDLLASLVKGDVVQHTVTIPEGYSNAQIGSLLEEKGLADREEFVRATQDPSLIQRLGIHAPTLEGYLFPNTYHFTRHLKTETMIVAMVSQFEQAWTAKYRARAAELKMSVHQVLTLASVVEKETGAARERGLISGVFHNRLKRKIPLQSDPTVIYALASFDGDLRKKDLSIESPYNTYKVRGLPPGPISNPGSASIHAALFPVPTNYLYFVSRNDGSHQFSSTLSEHNSAVRKFQLSHRRRAS